MVWIFTGGRGSALNLIKRTTEIKQEEREKVEDIRRKSIEAEAKLERAATLRKEEIRKRMDAKIEAEKQRIKKQQDLIRGDSEAINKDINDALNS